MGSNNFSRSPKRKTLFHDYMDRLGGGALLVIKCKIEASKMRFYCNVLHCTAPPSVSAHSREIPISFYVSECLHF